MKLNNRGFAISAILYTLLILFTLTLISLIAGLNSRNKMLEKSIESIERKYNWDCIDEAKDNNLPNLQVAEKRGKYIFKGTNEEGNTIKCITYINKSEILNPDKLTYTTSNCNLEAVKSTLKLTEYCPDNRE